MEFELDERSLNSLIMEHMRRHALFDTLCMFSLETGQAEVERGDAALCLQQLILSGRWDDVCAYVSPLKRYVSNFDKVTFEIRKQQYLEALCWQGAKDTHIDVTPWRPLRQLSEGGFTDTNDEVVMDRVMEVLKSLEDLCSQVEFNKLCNCLTFSSLSESPDYSEWTVTRGRFECVDAILDLLKDVLPEYCASSNYPTHGLEEMIALGLECCVNRAKPSQSSYPTAPIKVAVDEVGLLYPDIPRGMPSNLPRLTILKSKPNNQSCSDRCASDSGKGVECRNHSKTDAVSATKPPLKWTTDVGRSPDKRRNLEVHEQHLGYGNSNQHSRDSGNSKFSGQRDEQDGREAVVQHTREQHLGHNYSNQHSRDSGNSRLSGQRDEQDGREAVVQHTREQHLGHNYSNQHSRDSGNSRLSGQRDEQDGREAVVQHDETTVFSANSLATGVQTVSTAGLTASTISQSTREGHSNVTDRAHRVDRVEHHHKPAPTRYDRMAYQSHSREAPQSAVIRRQKSVAVRWSEISPGGIDVSPVCIRRDSTPLRCVATFSSDDPLDDSLVTDSIEQVKGQQVRIAIGSNSNTLCILGMSRPSKSVEVMSELKGVHHGDKCSVYTCDWSKDAAVLATGSNDRQIRIIRSTGRTQHSTYGVAGTLKDHNGTVRSVRFSPYGEGSDLASGGAGDCRLRVWDVQTGSCTKMTAHQAHIHGVSWLAPNTILTGCDKGLLLAQDTRTASVVWSVDLGGKGICSCQSLPDDGLAIVGHANGSISLLDTRERRLLSSYSVHGADVRSVALWNEAPFGGLCALTTSFDGNGSVWSLHRDATHGRVASDSFKFVKIVSLVGHTDKILCSSFCPVTSDIFTSGADGNVMCWSPQL